MMETNDIEWNGMMMNDARTGGSIQFFTPLFLSFKARGEIKDEEQVSKAQMGAFFAAMTIRANAFPEATQWSEGEMRAMKTFWPLLVRVLPPDVVFVADPEGLMMGLGSSIGPQFVGNGTTEMRLVGALREVLAGGHLGFEEVQGVLKEVLPFQVGGEKPHGASEALLAAFLIGQRMNRETDRELKAYCLAFDDELGPPPIADVKSLTHYGEPYDGNTRFFRSTLFVAAVRSCYGESCLLHGVDWMPPKGGITEEQMLKFMGANISLSPFNAKKLLELWFSLHLLLLHHYGHVEGKCCTKARQQSKVVNVAHVTIPVVSEEITISAAGYNEFLQFKDAHQPTSPTTSVASEMMKLVLLIYSLIGIREHIKKRPPLATTEKVQQYIKASGKEAIVTGFYHGGYEDSLLMLMKRRGVHSGLVVKGEEGALSMTTRLRSVSTTKGIPVNYCSGFHSLDIASTSELGGVTREGFSLEVNAKDYGFQPTDTPRTDRSVSKNIELGLAALSGEKGPAYDRIVLNAGMVDHLLGAEGAEDISVALGRAREAIDSGNALKRLLNYIKLSHKVS
ncbi:anthranilate phosphoribosyltransferase-like protein [Trifolium pratense]|uniref:Anthranilate phosphoribosyltransferase-like protein n=1 Tax=Trifolium pratense TaxID=57577 RepID=A0A2K3P1N6_TRIPR|nr:anthranilate phosphoribosyltransferase-like protein [Trifolium pratense]